MKKVLFVGGGTLGPVTPLLAVLEAWKKQDPEAICLWVGTARGPERAFVQKHIERFYTVKVARLVRSFSWEWVWFPVAIVVAFLQAYWILVKEKPDVIAAAGGYTSVPLVIVGRCLGIPSWIHQSDVQPILTNRLLSPFATRITVAWPQSAKAFPKRKTSVVGNPVREHVLKGIRGRGELMFGCDPKKPTVFIFGGGTGSQWLNNVVRSTIDELCPIANVIHVTGKGKKGELVSKPGYFVAETFLDEMADAYAVADVVVSRAGTGAISELAALKKASIVIPLPNTPQEKNARAIERAAVVLHQSSATPLDVFHQIRRLLNDPLKRIGMGQRLGLALETDCADRLVKMLETLG